MLNFSANSATEVVLGEVNNGSNRIELSETESPRPPRPIQSQGPRVLVEIARLAQDGYGCKAIQEALAAAGVIVSKSTVQRELARLSRPAPIAAWQMPVLPAHQDR